MFGFFNSLYNAHRKELETLAYMMIFIPLIIAMILSYKAQEDRKLSQVNLRYFSDLLISKDKNSKKEYNNFLKNRELIKLKDHHDFFNFRCTNFLKKFLKNNLGETMIPKENLYGLCAILSSNYSELRKSICSPLFLSDAKCSLFKVYKICREKELSIILIKHQDIFFINENIGSYNYSDLASSIKFLKLYFLYLLTIETPEIARNLNAQDFYPFLMNTSTAYGYNSTMGMHHFPSNTYYYPQNIHYSTYIHRNNSL